MALGTRTGTLLPTDVSTSVAILYNRGRHPPPPTLAGDAAATAGMQTIPTAVSQDFATRTLPGGNVQIRNIIYTASSLLQQFRTWQEYSQIEDAIKRFGLDRDNASHVMSAYAYVWAKNIAPLIYWRLPHAGHTSGLNEKFAQALGRYERDNPGTVFLATKGDRSAGIAIGRILDRVLGGLAGCKRYCIRRSSKPQSASYARWASSKIQCCSILHADTDRQPIACDATHRNQK